MITKDKKTFLEHILPWINLVITISGFIFLYVSNQSTNETLKEINDSSIKNAVDIKKYELSYPDKIRAFSDLRISTLQLYSDLLPFHFLTDISWPKQYTNAENRKIDSISKIARESLGKVNEKAAMVYPFLKKIDRDSLQYYTEVFRINTESYFNRNGLFQGINKYRAYDIWVYTIFMNSILKLQDKALSETY